jgi:hypothetical protein
MIEDNFIFKIFTMLFLNTSNFYLIPIYYKLYKDFTNTLF